MNDKYRPLVMDQWLCQAGVLIVERDQRVGFLGICCHLIPQYNHLLKVKRGRIVGLLISVTRGSLCVVSWSQTFEAKFFSLKRQFD